MVSTTLASFPLFALSDFSQKFYDRKFSAQKPTAALSSARREKSSSFELSAIETKEKWTLWTTKCLVSSQTQKHSHTPKLNVNEDLCNVIKRNQTVQRKEKTRRFVSHISASRVLKLKTLKQNLWLPRCLTAGAAEVTKTEQKPCWMSCLGSNNPRNCTC